MLADEPSPQDEHQRSARAVCPFTTVPSAIHPPHAQRAVRGDTVIHWPDEPGGISFAGVQPFIMSGT